VSEKNVSPEATMLTTKPTAFFKTDPKQPPRSLPKPTWGR